MKKIWIFLALVIALIPVGLWYYSPERVVKRQAKHLMEVVSMSSGSVGPMRQAKVYSMNALLDREVELVIPEIADANGTFDKQEMESAFSWICQNAKSSDFRVTDFRKVEVEGENATTHLRVEGFMELPGSRPADGAFDVLIHWKKAADGWRFYKVVWKNL